MGTDERVDVQLDEITSFIVDMANLNFRTPPAIRGDEPLDAVIVGLTALGEELQATVVAKEVAEAANNAKVAFLANVGHELRTPLTTILGSTELLSQSKLSTQQQSLIQQVTASTLALQRLVTDLLDYSRIDGGFLSLTSLPFSIEHSLVAVTNQCEKLAKKKGLSLSLNTEDLHQDFLVGDSGRFEQILHNIIGNSIKYTNEGEIRICASARPVGDSAEVVIDVADTGKGIANDKFDLIFERFGQVDTSLNRMEDGVGLGLSISRSLARKMSGDITVVSTLGQGSTFSISLKLPRTRIPKIVQTANPNGSIRKQYVLLVDDNQGVRETTELMLQSLGCTVTCVESGEKALLAMMADSFDIVLMDCQMPEMDGLETTKQAMAVISPQPKIIALTAHATETHRGLCANAGMIDYLAKPFRMADLFRIISKHR